MSSYYYLMAQLPGILANVPLSISYAAFKETASRFLSSKDKAILDSLTLEPPRAREKTGSSLVDGYYSRERALRLSLERLRAAALKRETNPSLDDDESINDAFETVQTARNAVSFESPLDAELYLIHARMSYLEQLRGNHYFDSDAVFAYGLMLLLHERGDLFTADAGRASYTTIYNQILGE